MTDRLLDKYARRSGASDGADVHAAEAEDLGCFGWLRGVRDRAIMLELRKSDGHILAVGYTWIERIELLPEEGITLHLPGRKIRIKGSALNAEARPSVRLFDGLVRQRVPWVRESDRAELLQADSGTALVESIAWED